MESAERPLENGGEESEILTLACVNCGRPLDQYVGWLANEDWYGETRMVHHCRSCQEAYYEALADRTSQSLALFYCCIVYNIPFVIPCVAQDALDAYNAQKRDGVASAPEKLSMTVQMVYDGWSEREYKKLERAGRTSSLQSHKAAWNKWVFRYALRKMRDVTLEEWQSILAEDEENGLSQSLINNDAILIRALYAYAMERDVVGKDYSMYLDIPSVDAKKKKGAFTDLQMKKLEQMAASGFPWADTALMLCYTGFRISEFLELTRFAYHPENSDYLQGGKKTQAGKDRIIPVHPKIAPYLRAHLEAGGDTIITKDGRSVASWWYRVNAFPVIAEALGEPSATPHWCRHTFATRLHDVGVEELTRKWLMGHSTKSDTTAGYTHSILTCWPRQSEKSLRK